MPSRLFDQVDANGDVNVALVGAVTVESDVLGAGFDKRDVAGLAGGGPDDFAISSDSKEVAYITNTDADQALSTNTDLFIVPIAVQPG